MSARAPRQQPLQPTNGHGDRRLSSVENDALGEKLQVVWEQEPGFAPIPSGIDIETSPVVLAVRAGANEAWCWRSSCMTFKSAILACLGRGDLKKIVEDMGIDGVDRRSIEAMRSFLASSPQVAPEDLLVCLRLPELRRVCEYLDVPKQGNRGELVDRLLADGEEKHQARQPRRTMEHETPLANGRTSSERRFDRKERMSNNHSEIEKRLWASADELRANSKLKSSEYSVPVLGLIFLRYADHRFSAVEKELAGKGSGRRTIGKEDYQAKGVMYLPPQARFSKLLALPEGENIGKAINEAMKAVEAENKEVGLESVVLPKNYNKIENSTLVSLLKTFSQIPMDVEGDMFGKIYEYFLGNFARAEGAKGGEFFTPTSLVKLIVEIIEPYHGRIFDPASGSGGMFVQSAGFVKAHKKSPDVEITVYGQEKVEETRQLALMNLAVHALSGDIRQGNSYYEDLHNSVGKFDFVMANPPFNVDKVDKEKIKDDPRYPFGMPKADNANYLWIEIFYSALNAKGRAGFVMANSAADARQSEMEIRKKLLQAHAVDVMIAIGPNFFYTVTLPCTLWFLDRGKATTDRKDKVLFIDARHIFRQMDRAHRKFSPKQIEFIANIARLYRVEKPEFVAGDDEEYPGEESDLKATFPKLKYADVPGLCKVATLKEIEAQGWSLNPGRYVGVAEKGTDDFDFAEKLEELTEELEVLNSEARELEDRIAANVAELLEGPK